MAEPNQYPNYLFLIIPLIVFLRPSRWLWWLLILGLGFVFGVTLTSWIARYLVPAYPALTIVSAYTLTALSSRLKSSFSTARILPAYVVGLLLITVLFMSLAAMRRINAVGFAGGSISRHDFLAPLIFYRPLDFMNNELPPEARVMSVGAQMTYGLDRPYLADETWFTTKWRRLLVQENSLERVNAQLKAQGITHILYNPSLFIFAAQMGVDGTGGMNLIRSDESGPARGLEYQLLRNWSTFTLYKERYLEPVYTDDYYEVLRIK